MELFVNNPLLRAAGLAFGSLLATIPPLMTGTVIASGRGLRDPEAVLLFAVGLAGVAVIALSIVAYYRSKHPNSSRLGVCLASAIILTPGYAFLFAVAYLLGLYWGDLIPV